MSEQHGPQMHFYAPVHSAVGHDQINIQPVQTVNHGLSLREVAAVVDELRRRHHLAPVSDDLDAAYESARAGDASDTRSQLVKAIDRAKQVGVAATAISPILAVAEQVKSLVGG